MTDDDNLPFALALLVAGLLLAAIIALGGCCVQRTAVETGVGDQITPITGAETWIEADIELPDE